jgi:hypothetical protein
LRAICRRSARGEEEGEGKNRKAWRRCKNSEFMRAPLQSADQLNSRSQREIDARPHPYQTPTGQSPVDEKRLALLWRTI